MLHDSKVCFFIVFGLGRRSLDARDELIRLSCMLLRIHRRSLGEELLLKFLLDRCRLCGGLPETSREHHLARGGLCYPRKLRAFLPRGALLVRVLRYARRRALICIEQ